jgi:hypothetical protein
VLRTSGSNEVPKEYNDHLYKMLNWIDWLGILITHKSLSEQRIIFDSIRPQLVEIIQLSREIIKGDMKRHGEDYWAGLRTVADALKVDLNKTSLEGTGPDV